MSFETRSLAISHLLLRLSLVLALFSMLTIPHPGMTAVTEPPAMMMHHTPDAQNKLNHSGVVHGGMNGALCAMFCAGLATAEGPVFLARFDDFVFARWTMDAGAVWVPVQPDPAQRPPDTPPIA